MLSSEQAGSKVSPDSTRAPTKAAGMKPLQSGWYQMVSRGVRALRLCSFGGNRKGPFPFWCFHFEQNFIYYTCKWLSLTKVRETQIINF